MVFVLFPTLYVTLAVLLLGFRYWEPTYEDTLNLIARLPAIAAYIYRRYVKHIHPDQNYTFDILWDVHYIMHTHTKEEQREISYHILCDDLIKIDRFLLASDD